MLRAFFAKAGWVLVLLLVAGAAVAGYAYYTRWQAEQARQAEAAALRTETVRRGPLVAAVSATGSVLPEQQASLYFSLPGTVAEVLVASGDRVEEGQVLARLQTTELRLALQQAQDALAVARLNRARLAAGATEAEVEAARAAVRAANAAAADLQAGAGEQEVAIAQLRYDNLQAAYQSLADQYNGLVQFAKDNPRFAPPQETLDSLKANMETAYFTAEIARLQLQELKSGSSTRGQLSVAYAQIEHARAVLSQTLAGPSTLQLAQADLAIEQAEVAVRQAELRLAQAELVAPFAGVVGEVAVRPGETAGPTAPALTLLDVDTFHLDVSVDEVDVAQLAEGQPVSVTVDALPGVLLSGRVERLAPTATTEGGLVNYSVRLALDDTGAPLRAGMSATAEIVVAELDGAVLVPNWAIRRDRRTGQAYASLLVNGALTEVAIETGLRGETHTQVLAGVEPGDTAAISTARDTLDFLPGGGG